MGGIKIGIPEFVGNQWNRFGWHGDNYRHGDSFSVEQLPYIEMFEPGERVIFTSIDCYVTGSYTDRRGRVLSIKQRYSIDVKYSSSTFSEVMDRLRREIVSRFEIEYGSDGFMIDNVFVPHLIVPKTPSAIGIYGGSRAWRNLLRRSQRDSELSNAESVHRSRVRGIIRRYSRRVERK